METLLGPYTLKENLFQFEADIKESINAELTRINRKVLNSELSILPFPESFNPYVTSISVQENIILIETSFEGNPHFKLEDLLFECEIRHWDLIELLITLRLLSN